MSTQSFGGALYYISFIDDFSHKVWIYFIKQKSEAFSKFKEFKAEVENESGYSIGTLRIDNGGEFTSNEFNQYCKDNGIQRQLTVPHTP